MLFRSKVLLELARSRSPLGAIGGYPTDWATFFQEPRIERESDIVSMARRHATVFQNIRREQGSFRIARASRAR